MDPKTKVERFPTRPGVYLMKDAHGRVLYVGKAKNLRARVRNYFRAEADGRPNVRLLMERTADIEWVLTESEQEAYILENSLIKKHRPRYNLQLRDDKSYLSLKITLNEPFPRLIPTRQDQARRRALFRPLLFGPRRACHRGPPAQALPAAPLLRGGVPRPNPPLHLLSDAGVQGALLRLHFRGGLPENGQRGDPLPQGPQDGATGQLEGGDGRGGGAGGFRDGRAAARPGSRAGGHPGKAEGRHPRARGPGRRGLGARRGRSPGGGPHLRSGSLLDRRGYYLNGLLAEDAETMAEFLRRYYREDRIIPAEVLVDADLGEEAEPLERWLSEAAGGACA